MQDLSLNFTLGMDAFYWTLVIIFLFLVSLILLIRSGHGYSVHDTQAHASEYAGEIKEGHGGMTAFLWVFFTFMLVWTIVYFILHAGEFAIVFAGGG
jgi:preprotein translocase subunit SecG